MKNKYEIENILGITTWILGITAWIAFFIALYNNHIDYAILFVLFAHIFNSENKKYWNN